MGGIWLVGTPFGLYGMSGEPQGPPKGIFCPKRCPFGGPRSAVEVFEEAGAHDMQTAQPDESASGSWAKSRSPGALRGHLGPPKGPFWAKTGPFGDPRSAVEVFEEAGAHVMHTAQPDESASGSWDQFWTQGLSGALERAYLGQNGPFWGPQECRSGL